MSSYDAHHQIRCKALGQSRALQGFPPLGSLVLELWSPKKGGKTNENDTHLSHMKKNRYNFILLLYWSCFVLISSYFKCLDSCKHWKGLKFTISTQSFSGKNLRFRWGGCFRKPLKKHRRSGIHGFKVSVTKVLNKKRRIPRAQAPFRRMDDGSGWYAK